MGLFNHFPYTNFHDLNLDWAIDKIKELVTEGETLYAQLQEWKTDTDADLAEWKTDTDADLAEWKADTLHAIESWEQAVAASLESWKTTTIADFEAEFTQYETAFDAIRASAEAAITTAQAAASGAETQAEAAAQAAAEARNSASAAASTMDALYQGIVTSYNLLGQPWEMGSLAAAGQPTAGTNRLRSADFFQWPPYSGDIVVSVAAGYSFRVCRYTRALDPDTQQYVYTFSGHSGAALRITDYTVAADYTGSEYWYKMLMARTDNSRIWAADATDAEIAAAKAELVGSLSFAIHSTITLANFREYVDTQIAALEQRVAALEADEPSPVPAYFEDQLAQNVATINGLKLSSGLKGAAFNFITDIHWANNNKNSPSLVEYICKESDIPLTICGGDIMRDSSAAANVPNVQEVTRAFSRFNLFPVALGNHDFYDKSSGETVVLTSAQAGGLANNLFMFNADQASENSYFYFDSALYRTRFIILNSAGGGTSTELTDELMALGQWLSAMPEGYNAVIITHIYFNGTTTMGTTIDHLTRNAFGTGIANVVDTFMADNTRPGDVAAIFAGHSHIDGNTTTEGGVPVILTQCDARNSYTTTNVNGTVDSQAFDTVIINYDTRTINCVRTGRGSSRSITY